MSFHIDAVSPEIDTRPIIRLSPGEIATAILPALIGMAGVALVAVLMLL